MEWKNIKRKSERNTMKLGMQANEWKRWWEGKTTRIWTKLLDESKLIKVLLKLMTKTIKRATVQH